MDNVTNPAKYIKKKQCYELECNMLKQQCRCTFKILFTVVKEFAKDLVSTPSTTHSPEAQSRYERSIELYRKQQYHAEVIRKWYEEEFNTAFEANKFHEEKYSKLNKDIFNQLFKDSKKKGISCLEKVLNFLKSIFKSLKIYFFKILNR